MARRLHLRAMVLFLALEVAVYAFVSTALTSLAQRQTAERLDGISRLALDLTDARYPGDWRLEAGTLRKGAHPLNGDEALVDRIRALSGAAATVFARDLRVATNVTKPDGSRAIGTSAAPAVIDAVLKRGLHYEGTADVVGQPYAVVYQPLRDPQGEVVGMFFVGVPVGVAIRWTKAPIQSQACRSRDRATASTSSAETC